MEFSKMAQLRKESIILWRMQCALPGEPVFVGLVIEERRHLAAEQKF
jgi:hypothetical protein